jgi:hypothetical protein
MNHLFRFCLLFLFSIFCFNKSFSQNQNEKPDNQYPFEGTHFKGYSSEKELLRLKQQFARMANAKRGLSGIVTLPVVVHVVYNGTVGVVSDAQIQNGITYLNEAFGGTGYFNTSVETNIRFKLAQRDPQGNTTKGITRDQSQYTSMDMQDGADGKPLDDLHVKDLNRWNPKEYMNVWIVNDVHEGSNTSVAGYAYLPGVLSADINRDGIIMESNYFGSSAANTSVLIHEMGHYFGLLHTFDGGCVNNDCTIDGDGICDTPPSSYDDTYSCTINKNSCSTDVNDPSTNNPFRSIALGGLGDVIDLKQNFMDYSNITCYQSFTPNQASRMYDVLANIRIGLANSLGLFPCSTKIQLSLSWPLGSSNAGNPITVSNNTTGALTYKWFINGAQVSTLQNLSYTPTQSGLFHIQLLAQNANQYCDVKDSNDIQILCPVISAFTYTDLKAIPNQALTLTNTSTNASSYEWYVNDIINNSNTDFTFSSANPGIYKISLKSISSGCSEWASDALVTVVPSIQPQTGFPIWPMIPNNTSLGTAVDFRSSPATLTTFTKPISNSSSALGAPAYNDCGEIMFYAVHDGTYNANCLNIFSTSGVKLTTTGLNGIAGNGEIQVLRIPGKSNDWYIIYREWTNNIIVYSNPTYTPTNWRYAHVHYSGNNDFKLISDNPLTLGDGSMTTYTSAAAVSRTVNGNINQHYLYLMQRKWGIAQLEMHRYLITSTGVTFDKSTGTIPFGWSNIGCTMVSAELSANENLLAASFRSYDAGAEDIVLIDCKYFDNLSNHFRTIVVESQLMQNASNTWITATNVASNIGSSVSYMEFSPNNKFLYFTSGGNTGNNYLAQLEIHDSIFYTTNKLYLRALQTTSGDGLYDISSAYNGNLYFIKRNVNTLFVIPEAKANNYLVQNINPTNFDLSTAQTPNIVIPNGTAMVELADQIDGYDYLNANATDVDIAIKAVDCNGNCSSKTFTAEVFDAVTGEVIKSVSISNCNTHIHFCANYFNKYSLRETTTGKVFNNAIVNSLVIYPSGQTAFTFLPETNCGSVCNMSDAVLTSISQSCQGNQIRLSVTIQNNGLQALPATMPITVYNNSVSIASIIKTTIIGSQIEASQSKTIQIAIPKQVNSNILVQLNDDGTFASKGSYPVTSYSECSYTNNTSSIKVQYPVLQLNIGNDISMCQNESRILTADTGFVNYLWLNNYSTKRTFTAYTSGIYIVEATDVCGIQMTDTLKITIQSPSAIITKTICQGTNYTYNNTTYSTTGSFIINKTNASGCDSIITLNLTVQALPTVSISTSSQSINSNSAVTLTATILPVGNYNYKWTQQPNATTLGVNQSYTFTPTARGTYLIAVEASDATAGCTSSSTANVIIKDSLNFRLLGYTGQAPNPNTPIIASSYPINTINYSNDTDLCAGQNYTILTEITNAGSGNYSYKWSVNSSSQTISSSPNISVTPTNALSIYQLQITDLQTFATATSSFKIAVHENPDVRIMPNSDTASLFETQQIGLTGTAFSNELGTTFVKTIWSGNGAIKLDNITSAITNFTSVAKGPFDLTYTVTDNHGCIGNSNIRLNVRQRDSITIGFYNPITCADGSTGYYSSGSSYNWKIEPPIPYQGTNPTSSIYVIWNIPGIYTITVEDNNTTSYQKAPKTFTVRVNTPFIFADKISGPQNVCSNETATYSVNTSNQNESFSWNVTASNKNKLTSSNNSATVIWKDIDSVTEIEKLQINVSDIGCSDKDTIYPITIHKNPVAHFITRPLDSTNTKEIYPYKTVDFDNRSYLVYPTEINNKNLTYFWDFIGEGVFVENDFEPTYNYDEKGIYHASLVAVDPIWGCKDTAKRDIVIVPNPHCNFVFPNTFIPEAKSDNNFGYSYSEGLVDKDFSFKIYNRWGQLIWETNSRFDKWDGRFKGEVCKQDVYVYHVSATCENGKGISKNGDVTLLK